ncbi:phytoene/squalene synthase family protein [Kiloniella laminariae]|uniref:Phytoene/squalene synthase family protein n=1 Tax=Kiloniella laminariae TaxID=454162 RepID=A0ABT4LQM5_9PROT|nr:phytoene/squalene synthase family protein [Kiloniella laminariae]MCZ4282616.1 phytoene/squalene synthase family protein [Kiloniella laminariae]
MNSSGLSYCGSEVKKHDYDRYLTSLFAPEFCREGLFALYAFNYEIAKTAEVVSEPLTGMIRLQWWRESLDGIYAGTPRNHEVVLALARVIEQFSLSREAFDRLIDAREVDLEDEGPASKAQLLQYLRDTSAALFEVACEVSCEISLAGEKTDRRDAILKAGSHMGMAWGLLGLIRAIPFHAQRKRLYLPKDLVASSGISTGRLFELESSPELCGLCEDLAKDIRESLRQARAERSSLPASVRPVLMVGILADQYLKRLESRGYDPFDPALQGAKPSASWRLMWANFVGSY